MNYEDYGLVFFNTFCQYLSIFTCDVDSLWKYSGTGETLLTEDEAQKAFEVIWVGNGGMKIF